MKFLPTLESGDNASAESRQWPLTLLLSVLVLVIIGIALGWFTQHESKNFRDTQTLLANSSGLGVVRSLTHLIQVKHESVESMVHHEAQLLKDLVQFPVDEEKLDLLALAVKSHLSGYFNYMLTDETGQPLLQEKLTKMGPQCLNALDLYARDPAQHGLSAIMHASGEHDAHFDVMAHLDDNPEGAIFFVSFHVDSIIEVLRNAELPLQSILLVKEADPSQVEISTPGAFQSLFGDRLSDRVQERVLFEKPVPETGWRVLVVANSDIFSRYTNLLIDRSIVAFIGVLVIVLFFLRRLWVEEKSREMAQTGLRHSHKLLENRVKQRTDELAVSEQNLRNTFMSAPFGMLVIDEHGLIESVNEQVTNIFGYEADEIIGQSIESLVPDRYRDTHKELRKGFERNPQTRLMGNSSFLSGLRKNGEEFAVEVGLSSLRLSTGEKVIASVSDVSEIPRLQQQLMEQHELAVVTLSSIGDGVISTDIEGSITTINTMAEKLCGWSAEEALGKHIDEVFHVIDEETREKVDDPVMRCIQDKGVVEMNSKIALIHRNGMDIPIKDSAAPIRNDKGDVIGVVVVFHDVSQSRAHASEIEFQAHHDALTGLINRRKFDSRLAAAIEQAHETGSSNILLFMDLDRFKRVNDTAGHAAGDELLKQLTRLLSSKLRQRDELARLGGDEFALILQHCSRRVGLDIANKLISCVENFRFFWQDQVFSVGISIGLVSFSGNSASADNLLSEADAACYTAKEGGRNRVHVYDDESARKRGESSIINILEEAFENNRMQLYQQQIRATNAGEKARHYEILIRMQSASGEIISPGMFLPAAERYGLATTLDRWVTKTTFEWLATNQQLLKDPLILSINLSGQSLTDTGFREFIRLQFNETSISTESICFEITETAAMNDRVKAIQFIQEIKAMGCKFSLDDFGSGHASYAHLKHLPVDYLKIDGLFVKDIVDDDINRSIVKSVNDIGHALGLKTIAEFVENDAISAQLTELGVDYLQGYGIKRPQPLDDLLLPDQLK